MARPSSALVPSRRITIGERDLDPAEGLDDAVGHLFAAGDAAEDVDEDGLDLRVGVDDLEGVGHDVGVGPAADVEEVGRLPPTWLTTSSVLMASPAPLAMMPTVAVEPDVLQALLLGELLALVELLGGREARPTRGGGTRRCRRG